ATAQGASFQVRPEARPRAGGVGAGARYDGAPQLRPVLQLDRADLRQYRDGDLCPQASVSTDLLAPRGTGPRLGGRAMPERGTLFPLLEALISRYRMVVGLPLAAAVLTSVLVLLMSPSYASTASFVPENPLQSRLPSSLAGIASQFGLNLGEEASRSPAFYADLIRSREILGEVLAAKIPGAQSTDS